MQAGEIQGSISGIGSIAGALSTLGTVDGSLVIAKIIDREAYKGQTEITPEPYLQTFETDGKVINGNFIVNPIPSNYGLITWNGSTLTVS